MIPSPNQFCSPLHDLPSPAAWTSKQAQRLVHAITKDRYIVDLYAAPVELAFTVEVARVAYGATATAEAITRDIDRAQARLDAMRGTLRAYGAEAFTPHNEPERAPYAQPGDDQQTYMLRWMDSIFATGRTITRAGNSRIERNTGGAYIVVAKEVV